MLNELDNKFERRGLNFVRYANYCIIFIGSEKSANGVMENITKFIENKLDLKVNAGKSKVDKPNEIKYLGFGFFYDRRAKLYKVKPHQI